MLIGLLVCFVWAVICLGLDMHITNKGLRAGIAVEGNSLIVFFARTDKPALWQLIAVDGTLRLLMLAFSFIPGPTRYPLTFCAMGIGMFVVAGFKNLQGYRQWSWMFSHKGERLPQQNSAWAQFMGFWG